MGKLSNKLVDYVIIKTKSWEKYVMSWTIDERNKLLNWVSSFIRLWTWLVNKFEIVSIDKYDLSDVDMLYVGSGTENNILLALEDLKKDEKQLKEYNKRWLYGLVSNSYFDCSSWRLF